MGGGLGSSVKIWWGLGQLLCGTAPKVIAVFCCDLRVGGSTGMGKISSPITGPSQFVFRTVILLLLLFLERFVNQLLLRVST